MRFIVRNMISPVLAHRMEVLFEELCVQIVLFGLKPAGDGARVWLRYPGSAYAAAVTYRTDTYRAVSLGVPVETLLRAADREWVLRQTMEFLYNGKKPANRR